MKPSPSPADQMPILLVVRALPGHRPGGLEFHTMDLANGLKDLGHPVTLLTTRLDNASLDQHALQRGLRPDIRVLTTPKCFGGNYSWRFWKTAAAMATDWAKAILSDPGNSPQAPPVPVIHCQEYAGIQLPAHPGGATLIHTIHGTLTSEVTVDPRYLSRLSLMRKIREIWRHKSRLGLLPWYRRMLRQADLLITDSQFTHDRLIQRYPDLERNIHVVPCGLDFSRLGKPTGPAPLPQKFDSQNPLRIAMLQRIQRQKGVAVALEAMASLVQEGLAIELEIAGTGDYLEDAKRLSRDLGIGQTVRFLGRIADAEVPNLLGRSHLLWVPDLTQPAFGLIAVEAMHHGLPVLAAHSGALPEVVPSTCGWIYEDPFSPKQPSEILRSILRDPAHLPIKQAAVQKQAARFSASEMARRTSKLYWSAAGYQVSGEFHSNSGLPQL